jgi:hypothetical protein
VRRDGAFIPAFASAGVNPQWFLDDADKEVEPQRKQNYPADGREDGMESRAGQVGEEIVTAEERQGEEDQVAGDRADSAGEGMVPTTDHAAADGQHVHRAHRRGRRQTHEVCGRKYMDVGDKHHVTADRLNRMGLGLDGNGSASVTQTRLRTRIVDRPTSEAPVEPAETSNVVPPPRTLSIRLEDLLDSITVQFRVRLQEAEDRSPGEGTFKPPIGNNRKLVNVRTAQRWEG